MKLLTLLLIASFAHAQTFGVDLGVNVPTGELAKTTDIGMFFEVSFTKPVKMGYLKFIPVSYKMLPNRKSDRVEYKDYRFLGFGGGYYHRIEESVHLGVTLKTGVAEGVNAVDSYAGFEVRKYYQDEYLIAVFGFEYSLIHGHGIITVGLGFRL